MVERSGLLKLREMSPKMETIRTFAIKRGEGGRVKPAIKLSLIKKRCFKCNLKWKIEISAIRLHDIYFSL